MPHISYLAADSVAERLAVLERVTNGQQHRIPGTSLMIENKLESCLHLSLSKSYVAFFPVNPKSFPSGFEPQTRLKFNPRFSYALHPPEMSSSEYECLGPTANPRLLRSSTQRGCKNRIHGL